MEWQGYSTYTHQAPGNPSQLGQDSECLAVALWHRISICPRTFHHDGPSHTTTDCHRCSFARGVPSRRYGFLRFLPTKSNNHTTGKEIKTQLTKYKRRQQMKASNNSNSVEQDSRLPLKSAQQKQKSSRQQKGQKRVVFFSARLVHIFDGTSAFLPFHELSLITCLGSLSIPYPDHIQKISTKKSGKLE